MLATNYWTSKQRLIIFYDIRLLSVPRLATDIDDSGARLLELQSLLLPISIVDDKRYA